MKTSEVYAEILTRLVTEVVSCVPSEWTHGTLTIESDGVRIDYKLREWRERFSIQFGGAMVE